MGNENEFIDIFRKVCTERLIMKGAYIQSTADSIETAFRKAANDSAGNVEAANDSAGGDNVRRYWQKYIY